MSDRPKLSTSTRQRLFAFHGGICHICKQPINGVRDRWEIDHVRPRGLIGRSADIDDNMRPAHERCHKTKTVVDISEIARAKRLNAKHFGAWRSKRPFRDNGLKRRMDGTVVRRAPAADHLPDPR